MNTDFQLFADPDDGEGPLDPDVAIMTAYLARELSPLQVLALEERLANDQVFRAEMQSLITAWAAPVAGVEGGLAQRVGTPTPAEIVEGWQCFQREQPERAPKAWRKSWLRVAAIVGVIVLPVVGFAQLVRYVASHPGAPGFELARSLRSVTSPPSDTQQEQALRGTGRSVVTPLPGNSAIPQAAAGNQLAIDSLKPQNGVLKDTVGNVSSMRELDDGRLLIVDGPIMVGDFTNGRISALRDVRGGKFIPLTHDSTLIVSSIGGWMLVDGVTPVGMLPASNAMVASNKELFGAGVDGKVLSVSGGRPESDSALLSRVNRLTGARDTVTKLWNSMPAAAGSPPSAALPVKEQASLAADGWLAVLRAHPYRVDWQKPTGEWVRGAPIPFPAIKYDTREKEALMAQLVRGSNFSPEPISRFKVWPDVIEPFTVVSLLLAPTGEALVMRTRSADATDTRYDVIDRRGMLVRQVRLSSHEKILGFGKSSVYVRDAVTRTGGKALIERHPWP